MESLNDTDGTQWVTAHMSTSSFSMSNVCTTDKYRSNHIPLNQTVGRLPVCAGMMYPIAFTESSGAQFVLNCAWVNIVGPGRGQMQFVKFLGGL